MTGTVLNYNREKGFGFIQEDGCDAHWFFHRSNLLELSLIPGDRVEFIEGEGPKGPVAKKVKIITNGNQ